MIETPLLTELIESLCCMPGIGRKSAQRIAYHLLQRNRKGAKSLGRILDEAMDNIGHCKTCRTFSEKDICDFCSSQRRDRSLLCVVESPADVYAIEDAHYRGLYFVLMGHLSPLDGIGPDDLGMDQLNVILANAETQEVILATGTTVEGEATAHYISEMVRKHQIKVTRIAHGIPMGGELEYLDSNTLSHALAGRREVE